MWQKKNGLKLKDLCKILQQYECQHCKAIENLTVDHVIPLHAKGFDHIANFQILCYTCNHKKTNIVMNNFLLAIKVTDFIQIIRQKTKKYNDFSYNYTCAVISNYFGIKDILSCDYYLIPMTELVNLSTYLNAYGIRNYGLHNFLKVKIKKVFTESNFLLKYNPNFILTYEFNQELVNSFELYI